MSTLLQSKLLVVTGKGGVGKTTVASAIGLLAAERGLRTIVVEVGEQERLPSLFGRGATDSGVEHELQPRLSSISIDPDRALLEWVQQLGGRVSGRVLASSSTFGYFAAAAPGAKEIVSMVKIWELTQSQRWRGRARAYDLVVFDAPATGHALGMLSAPRTFGAIARVGAVARQAERVQELLRDSSRTSYVAVAHAAEMAVTETLELQGGLRKELGRELAAVIVNCVLPRRFSEPELRRLASLNDDDGTGADGSPAAGPRGRPRAHGPAGREPAPQALVQAASAAARSVHERARFQHNQIARLRRRRLQVIPVPFRFAAELDLAAVRGIASQIGHRL